MTGPVGRSREFTFELVPLTPEEKQTRSLSLRIISAVIRGPMNKHRNIGAGYTELREILSSEKPCWIKPLTPIRARVARTLRHAGFPPAGRCRDSGATSRSGGICRIGRREDVRGGNRPGHDSRAGLAPVFVWRQELAGTWPPDVHPNRGRIRHWRRPVSIFCGPHCQSEELVCPAREHKLRENLPAQLKRLLADGRSKELIRNFTGQWLQARDIDSVNINAFAVVSRDQTQDPDVERRRNRFRELRNKPFESLTAEE